MLNLSQFSSEDLLHIAKQVARKEACLREAAAIDAELADMSKLGRKSKRWVVEANGAPERGGIKPGTKRARIEDYLRQHAERMVSLDELSTQLNVNKVNLSAFFSSPAIKRYPHIIRFGRGNYQWKESTVERAARPPGKRTAVIVSALQQAGKDGLTVAQVVERTGLNKSNVLSFFQRSAQHIPEIRKIGTLHYMWAAQP